MVLSDNTRQYKEVQRCSTGVQVQSIGEHIVVAKILYNVNQKNTPGEARLGQN